MTLKSSPSSLVYFDLETTSQDCSEAQIIEIAAFFSDGRNFQRFVDVAGEIPEDIYRLTHISPQEHAQSCVSLSRALEDFVAFVGMAQLAGHNIYKYDLPVLERAFEVVGLTIPLHFESRQAIDTLHWAQVRYPVPPERTDSEGAKHTLPGYKLGDLYQFFMACPIEGAHRALDDCRATYSVLEGLYHDAPTPAVQRLWTRLQLPEAAFYPAPELDDPQFEAFVGTQTQVPQVKSGGPTFPPTDALFPQWVESEVSQRGLDPEQVPALLKALEDGDTTFPRAQRLLAERAGVAKQARMIRSLAGSVRVRRQADGTVRAPQAEMARQVAQVLRGNGKVSLIQAPTGTGKTKAYLFPAQHFLVEHPQARVVVATHTKVLQKQALQELEHQASAYATHAVSVKSARNYLCLEAMAQALEEAARTPEASLESRSAHAVLATYAHQGHFDLEALPQHWEFNPAFRELRFVLESYASRCRKECVFYQRCAFQTDLRQREDAPLWLTNQAWLIAALSREGNPDDPRPLHLIIDEAHNLEDVATEAFSQAFSGERVRFHLHRLYTPEKRRGLLSGKNPLEADRQTAKEAREVALPKALEALERYDDAVTVFMKQFGVGDAQFGVEHHVTPRTLGRVEWQRLKRVELEFIGSLKGVCLALGSLLPRTLLAGLVRPTLDYLRDLIDGLYQRHLPETDNYIHTTRWHPEQGWSHLARPIDLAGPLQAVWNRAASVTLTSATLTSTGEFTYLKRVLGLPDATLEALLPESLPYERAHLLLPQHLPAARRDNQKQFVRLYQQELSALLPAAGRSLSLFTSRARMQQMGQALETLAPAPMMPLTRREREEVAGAMQEPGPKIALGTRAYMEGVDFPDLKLVNLERIPFPIPDALLRARQDHFAAQGLDPWYDFYLPKALLSFTQAFGRLIRDDRVRAGEGAFVLWDKRVLNAAYREVVFLALPQSLRTSGHLRRPENRREFYDLMAPILGVDRCELPNEELLDDNLVRLRAIQGDYQMGRLSRSDALDALLALFWSALSLKPEQLEAIYAALEGRPLLVLLPTGYGKSLTFQLPALLEGGLTLVISPLIALMEDQAGGLRERGVPAAAVNASRSGAEQRGILDEAMRGEVHLLYLSPERVNRSQELQNRLRNLIERGEVKRVVFDEAHCLSEWGHDFRPDYRQVLRELENLGWRGPVSALTATATRDVREQLTRDLALGEGAQTVWASSDRPNLAYYAYPFKGTDAALEKLRLTAQVLGWMNQTFPTGRAIVYVSTRKAATRLETALRQLDFKAAAYHAGLSALNRSEIQQQFKEGEVQVMVATNAFGMGVDQGDVRLVLHFSPPRSLPAYLQEVGRAGRDGHPAWGVLLHDAADWKLQRWLSEVSQPLRPHAERLLTIVQSAGQLTLYPDILLDRLNEDLEPGVLPVEADDLSWLLAALEEAGNLETGYRVGRVRLLSNLSESQLGSDLGSAQADRLIQLGYLVGPRPMEFDFAPLDAEEAERLNTALYELSRKRPFEVFYTPSTPVQQIRFKQGGFERFDSVVRAQLASKQRDLDAMRAFAQSNACRRRRLLKVFEEPLLERPPVEHCCQSCNGDSPPWAEAAQVSRENLEAVYRIDDTLLECLESDREGHAHSKSTHPYRGKGRSRLMALLQGKTHIVYMRGGVVETLALYSYELLSPFFGRLEFVGEAEVKKSLTRLSQQGLLVIHAQGEGSVISLSEQGQLHLDARRRKRVALRGRA